MTARDATGEDKVDEYLTQLTEVAVGERTTQPVGDSLWVLYAAFVAAAETADGVLDHDAMRGVRHAPDPWSAKSAGGAQLQFVADAAPRIEATGQRRFWYLNVAERARALLRARSARGTAVPVWDAGRPGDAGWIPAVTPVARRSAHPDGWTAL